MSGMELVIGKTKYRVAETTNFRDEKSGATYITHHIQRVNKDGLGKRTKQLFQCEGDANWWLASEWMGRAGIPKPVNPVFAKDDIVADIFQKVSYLSQG